MVKSASSLDADDKEHMMNSPTSGEVLEALYVPLIPASENHVLSGGVHCRVHTPSWTYLTSAHREMRGQAGRVNVFCRLSLGAVDPVRALQVKHKSCGATGVQNVVAEEQLMER